MAETTQPPSLRDTPDLRAALEHDLETAMLGGYVATERKDKHIDSPGCWCQPYQDTVEPTVWIHRQEARG